MTASVIPDDAQPAVTRVETCSLATVRRVAAMLDLDPDNWHEGDVLPRGWQFILLGADTRRSSLRGDGFPGLGVPLPDLGLPRLLLGGRTVRFRGDILIGTTLRRVSWTKALSRKESAHGPMAIVTVAHDLHLPDVTEAVLSETQTYILLGPQPTGGKPPNAEPSPLPPRTRQVVPDDTLLFQYSALGFNSHRIHLDRQFARDVEGFPDLVVNGGLAMLLLTEFLRVEENVTLGAITARHVAPLFCARPATLGVEKAGSTWLLRAFDDGGHLAVQVEVEEA